MRASWVRPSGATSEEPSFWAVDVEDAGGAYVDPLRCAEGAGLAGFAPGADQMSSRVELLHKARFWVSDVHVSRAPGGVVHSDELRFLELPR